VTDPQDKKKIEPWRPVLWIIVGCVGVYYVITGLISVLSR
jgi:hypothetical protein